ncbi:hypothetical protein DdX_18387 [Ditylenchus destructor]|uniref:Uncharacterized protein n=1 Tax=Ditylenchus destructor TaxID=166010 RepID=A0AAD4MJW2_9BILA|nr:hypothetical protein DdX_18387 [Ditylenchus destructor]
MYNKWLDTNSRSSTADTSIKAFISHSNFNYPEGFETLSSNAGVDCDALIAAFENGTNLDATVSNNDLSHEFACVVSTDEINNATGNNDNTPNGRQNSASPSFEPDPPRLGLDIIPDSLGELEPRLGLERLCL